MSSLLARGASDAEVLSEVAEGLHPYLIHGVDVETIEENGAAAKTVTDIEVDYKGLQCSGLRLSYDGHEKKSEFFQRVVDVCDILGRLRHPNLLQFLGVSYDSRDSSPPLIVSEYLPFSLAACVDRHGVLQNEISYNIVRDVALGLRYLHEQHPSFVHGDLSGKSILLGRDFTAKISQVGVSHLRVKERNMVASQCAHLPPEVTEHCKRFDRKVDVFSFGIVMLHTFTGRQPTPKQTSGRCDNEEGSPPLSTNRASSQAEIRQDYINDLGTNHPITDTILHCLRNQPLLRPEIWEISPMLCKQAASHRNVFRKSSAHHDILTSLKKERKRKFCKFFTQVSTSDSAYGSVSEAELEDLQIRCRRLSVQNQSLRRISLTPDHLVHLNNLCSRSLLSQPLTPEHVTFDWEKCAELPVGMYRAQATIVCGRVYIGGGMMENESSDFYVFEYNPSEDTWELMPPLPVKFFGLGKMAQDLVAVGGQVHNDELSDNLFVFDAYNQQWKESAAQLNTPRFSPTVVESDSSLVAMGGLGRDCRGDIVTLSSIEVLCIDSNRWTVTGDLPSLASVCSPSPAVEGNTLYLMGGYRAQTAISATSRVYTSSLSSLTSDSWMATKSWKPLPPTPHLQSTAVSLNHCLLALGGSERPYSANVHSSIYAYDSSTLQWRKVDDLPYAVCHSTAVAVTRDEIMVLGGWVKPGERKASKSVFRGRLRQSRFSESSDDTGDYITLPAITITSR